MDEGLNHEWTHAVFISMQTFGVLFALFVNIIRELSYLSVRLDDLWDEQAHLEC